MLKFILLYALAAACLTFACSGAAVPIDSSPQPQRLDDSANPYCGQYTDLDRWAWAHTTQFHNLEGAGLQALLPEQCPSRAATQTVDDNSAVFINLQFPMDEHGWQVPLALAFKQQLARRQVELEQRRNWTPRDLFLAEYANEKAGVRYDTELRPGPGQRLVNAWGDGEPSIRSELWAIYLDYAAQILPPIPAWLGANPPPDTIFLPDGDILCCGELGERYQNETDSMPDPFWMSGHIGVGDHWRRFSCCGQLLESYPKVAGEVWPAGYNTQPNLAALGLRGIDYAVGKVDGDALEGSRLTVATAMQYLRIVDGPEPPVGPPPTLLAAFDWNGVPLPLDQPVPFPPAGSCVDLDRVLLAYLYQQQLGTGRTDAGSVSPFAGTPAGPVVASSNVPRPLPRLAHGNLSSNQPDIILGSLNDPQNPYRAEYTSWDRWAYARIANMPADDQMEDWDGKPASDPSCNRSVTTAYQTELEVDARGFMLPLKRSEAISDWFAAVDYRQSPRPPPAFSAQRWSVEAYCRPSESKDFDRYKNGLLLRSYPPLPAWLVAKPVYSAVLLPDGSVVTLGEPGGYDPKGGAHHMGHITGRNGWQHYSTGGELLASDEKAREWVAATFSGFAALKQRELALGHDVLVAGGFVLVYDSPEMTGSTLGKVLGPNAGLSAAESATEVVVPHHMHLIAAYDYDGTPLPLDKPLTRPGGYCQQLDWQLLSAAQPQSTVAQP